MKLRTRYVEKPWGRTELPPVFAPPAGERIGEIWFVGERDLPLLAKYIFTSETLSVQVHPDDRQARLRGFGRGKSECWYVLDAEPGARIGLGLREEVTESRLRRSAIDGSISELIDWRPVSAGDFFYVAPGTIHAIGGGIWLLEFQQNSDVTFRLYDYGRSTELRLEDAVAVARPGPYPPSTARRTDEQGECVLVSRPCFKLVLTQSDSLQDRQRWVLPLSGRASCGGSTARPGECLLLEPGERLETEDARLLIGGIG